VGIHGQMWLFQIKGDKFVLQGDAAVN
jgi:hypothetical protein